MSKEILTHGDLYNFLRKIDPNDFNKFLQDSWKGKNKQEACFRLFCSLNLIPQFSEYDFCIGNFNKGGSKKMTKKDLDSFMKRSVKDKGDSADYVFIDNKKMNMVVGSSKETCHGVGKMDIAKIKQYESMYPTQKFFNSFVVKNKDELRSKMKLAESTSNKDREVIQEAFDNDFVFDWNDLKMWFINFKKVYSEVDIESLTCSDKKRIHLRPHQNYTVMKSIDLSKDSNVLLWGHSPRSGKSYMMGGFIHEYGANNVLIITLAPTETISQYIDIFKSHSEFESYNVIRLNGENLYPKISDKNIIICSKQFLEKRVKEDMYIEWLKEMKIDLTFIDETHFGGTTILSKSILKTYTEDSKCIFMTATYQKPLNAYNVPPKYQITWDIEDNYLCKKFSDIDSKKRLIEKHGLDFKKFFIDQYTDEYIFNCYKKFPQLNFLTLMLSEPMKKLIKKFGNSDYGISVESILMLKNNKKMVYQKFVNEKAVLNLLYMIFGKKNVLDIPDKKYEDCFMNRYEKICDHYDSRKPTMDNPLIMMCYLPHGNSKYPIDKLSNALIDLIKKHKVLSDYVVISINSYSNNGADAKKIIDDAYTSCKNSCKKGVLVLSGKQCTLGVTLPKCDIVLLLNNVSSFDTIWQTSFRCMTEADDKKMGFVFDCNIQRICNLIYNYANKIYPKMTTKKAIETVLEQRLIAVDQDMYFKEHFVTDGRDIKTVAKYIMNCNAENFSTYVKSTLLQLVDKSISEKDQNALNKMFLSRDLIIDDVFMKTNVKELEGMDQDVSKGVKSSSDIEYKEEVEDIEFEKEEEIEDEKYVKFMKDLMVFIIPLLCLYTIHNDCFLFSEMCKLVRNDDKLYNYFLNQISRRWNMKWSNDKIIILFNYIMQIYDKYFEDDENITNVIKQVKELFTESLSNQKKLSKLVDTYLIPTDKEKKGNAEIPTPFSLRKEMLDKIPNDIWKEKKTKIMITRKDGTVIRRNKIELPKIFESCSGKSGFIIDIIDRLMLGLKDFIPDEELRYKTIVEKCIYFSDINETNIYICRLLIDPYDKYSLNYNYGDTLKLNIKDKWGVNGFDAVISNPPYNSSGNTATGNTIWQHFVKDSLNKWIKDDGYLLYVHPPGWRKPNTTKGKFYGLFDLMTKDNQMKYLSIHNAKDGQKVFGCGTRYDWYLIQRMKKHEITEVVDETGETVLVNMSDFDWLPNFNIHMINDILAKDDDVRCPIIYNRSAYGADKKWVSDKQNDVFKYPCIHSTPKSGIRYKYSSINDKGHFETSKVIFGDSGIYLPVIDMEGKYGMTQHSMGIEVDSLDQATDISKAIQSEEFGKLIKSCSYSSYAIDWNIFKDFKKDFWTKFV